MIRRPPRSTQSRSSAASDVYKRQFLDDKGEVVEGLSLKGYLAVAVPGTVMGLDTLLGLSLIHISEPTRPY